MALYFGDGIGDDPPLVNLDKTFTDDGYMVVGGQLIDLKEPVKAKEIKRDSSMEDDWMYR
jgi:hypothetical protein